MLIPTFARLVHLSIFDTSESILQTSTAADPSWLMLLLITLEREKGRMLSLQHFPSSVSLSGIKHLAAIEACGADMRMSGSACRTIRRMLPTSDNMLHWKA